MKINYKIKLMNLIMLILKILKFKSIFNHEIINKSKIIEIKIIFKNILEIKMIILLIKISKLMLNQLNLKKLNNNFITLSIKHILKKIPLIMYQNQKIQLTKNQNKKIHKSIQNPKLHKTQ
jgi:hypothetical protein